MAKRRKGKSKHYKKNVDDINNKTKKDRKRSTSDRRRERKSQKNGKSSKIDRQAKKRKDDIIFFTVLFIIVASIFGAYFAYDIYLKDNGDTSDNDNDDNNNPYIDMPTGVPAPDFELIDTDGFGFSLYDYLGNYLIINFIADYQLPSHDQMIHLKEIYEQYNHLGVEIVSIGISDDEDNLQIRENVKNAYECQWQFAAYGGDVAQNYGVSVIPAIFIVDPEGIIVFSNGGLTESDILREQLDNLL